MNLHKMQLQQASQAFAAFLHAATAFFRPFRGRSTKTGPEYRIDQSKQVKWISPSRSRGLRHVSVAWKIKRKQKLKEYFNQQGAFSTLLLPVSLRSWPVSTVSLRLVGNCATCFVRSFCFCVLYWFSLCFFVFDSVSKTWRCIFHALDFPAALFRVKVPRIPGDRR
jgi:hypothetical protein